MGRRYVDPHRERVLAFVNATEDLATTLVLEGVHPHDIFQALEGRLRQLELEGWSMKDRAAVIAYPAFAARARRLTLPAPASASDSSTVEDRSKSKEEG